MKTRPGSYSVASLSDLHDSILLSNNRMYGSRTRQGSWKGMLKATHTTMGLALLGAGAILLLRHISSSSISWLLQPRKNQSLQSSDIEDFLQLTLPGLRNTGNNCFLNAILQALSSSKRFINFLSTYDKENTLSLFSGVESNCQFLPLTEALSDLLTELSILTPESSVASPRHVMLALESYRKDFDLSLQQDAAEALAHLVDTLRDEQRMFFEGFKEYKYSFSHALACANGCIGHGIVMDYGCRKECYPLHNYKVQLHLPIEGTMASSLICHECGFQFSTQFQSFHDVPLSPVRFPDGNIADMCSLDACLQRYTAKERVTNVRCSRCSHRLNLNLLRAREGMNKVLLKKIEECTFNDGCCCEDSLKKEGGSWKNVYVNASKQLRLGRCPEVVCFHVQRAVISKYGDLVKWMGHVSFPRMLDLFPYTICSDGHSQSRIDHLVRTPVRLNDHSEVLQKFMWQKRTFEMLSKFDDKSNDESISDDTHTSTSSGIEDSTSDSSGDDDMLGKCKGALEQLQKEPSTAIISQCEDVNFVRDTKLCTGFQHQGQSTIIDPCFDMSKSQHPVMLETSMLGCTTEASNTNLDSKSLFRPANILPIDPCDSKKRLYDLISVVVHHGSARSGHYTVYRKAKFHKESTQKSEETVLWFRVSDSHVDIVSEQEVLMAQASLLFYEKCSDF